jgi:DNA-binding transcriptional MerR regulator
MEARLPRIAQGSSADAAHTDSVDGALTSTWPHQLSHEPSLRVSDVLQIIGNEFSTLTPSKLRFFDRQGLVSPLRTAAGYRQYSAADVERLRFVLREQRDHYRPLSVIQDILAQLDTGTLRQAITPREVAQDAADFVSAQTLAALAGVEEQLVAQMDAERLIAETVPGGYDRQLAPVVTAVAQYVAAGGDVRAARVLRNAAVREIDQARGSAAALSSSSDPGAVQAMLADRAHAASALFAAFAANDARA